jgi:hypothetical protein
MKNAAALLPPRTHKGGDSGWAVRTIPERIMPWSRSVDRAPREAWRDPKKREVAPATRLLDTIQKSKAILDLPDDWDDAGSPPFKLETWERVRHLLVTHAAFVWQRTGMVLPVPRILPGPNGSIDLHWKTYRRELLLNVPEDARESITYYGDDFGEDRKKGSIEPGALDPGLFTWLTMTD